MWCLCSGWSPPSTSLLNSCDISEYLLDFSKSLYLLIYRRGLINVEWGLTKPHSVHSKQSIHVSYYYRITYFTNKSMPLHIFLSQFLPQASPVSPTFTQWANYGKNVLQCFHFLLPRLSSPAPLSSFTELHISAYTSALWSHLHQGPLPLLPPSFRTGTVEGPPSSKPPLTRLSIS